tara:strand:+ start:1014 stop:1460 length:447 start_codon:yes stop_codon:yes gene_type:complete
MIEKILDYLVVVFLIVLVLLLISCNPQDDDILTPPLPTLELDGGLQLDNNGYYHLELRQDVHQTIHTISGIVTNYEYYEPLKVSWDSNLTWYLQNEWEVTTSNPASYVMDGNVINVIGPVKTMVGDTLILTGTIREHLVTDTIKFVLE